MPGECPLGYPTGFYVAPKAERILNFRFPSYFRNFEAHFGAVCTHTPIHIRKSQ